MKRPLISAIHGDLAAGYHPHCGQTPSAPAQENMRHVPVLSLLFLLLPGVVGCAAIRGLDDYTTADPAAALPAEDAGGGGPVGTEDAGIPPTGCQSNQECLALAPKRSSVSGSEPVPTTCVKATGLCQPLVTADCPRVTGDFAKEGAVVIGSILGNGATAAEQATTLAAEEISAAGGLPGGKRPLVVVGCDPGGDVLRATKHLSETLHVAAIIGPQQGEDVIAATQQVTAKGGTLLMTPTSTVSAITNLADGDLTWRALPSDAQRAKLLIQVISDLEILLRSTRALTTVKLGIVYPNDALGTSLRDSIGGKLILNGRFIGDAANAANVSVDGHAAGSASAEGAVATKYSTTFMPDIVVVTSADQIAGFVVPLEAALTAARAPAKPYYVLTDAARTGELLEAVAAGTIPGDIKRRVRGVGVKTDADSASVLGEFRAAFAARYGAALPPTELAAPRAYDATYAVAYALAAPAAATGASVANGLRALAVGTSRAVGKAAAAAALADLGAGRSVSLRGTYGPLRWDASGDATSGTIEVWCLGTVGGAPAYGSSGLTMDVETQVVGGAFVQCQ
ncbi:MAG: Branched-chain amino acid transporter, amino acid-binding protein [Labilithrix sp.]|nr:Branched-chain amino acid transporter, amino acid-binding protein [Labilithrix sp.]